MVVVNIRKVLLRSVHFFIHLNLAISLLCGYFIFAVGVETARNSSVCREREREREEEDQYKHC